MYLITSGEYVNQELETEFGKIPPAFLPLQNKRLFKHQINSIPEGENIYLSIPESFKLNKKDILDLGKRDIKTIRIPHGLSLGQSIFHSLNLIDDYNSELKIIHGDTLFEKIDYPADLFLVSKTNDNYGWAYTKSKIKKNIVYAGFFSFSNQSLLIKALKENDYDFIKSILSYKSTIIVREYYINKWYDLGHINTYYRSKSNLTTQRIFNDLKINNQTVLKVSSNKAKILAEVNWFNSIPSKLKVYTPNVFDYGEKDGKGFYELEYLFLSTLSELFVFGCNKPFIWEKIFESCQKFIESCLTFKPKEIINPIILNDLYAPKTYARLQEFNKKTNFDIGKPIIINNEIFPSLLEIVEETSKLIKPVSVEDICVTHGDFCFSNILYDFRTQNIKVIDPRGIDSKNNQLIYGDVRYDVAKFAHSVLGLYDHIVTNYYKLEEIEPYKYNFEIYSNSVTSAIQNLFVRMKFNGRSLEQLDTFPILVHLFLSMLPLHSDDFNRQKALLLNALRIYKQIKA